MTNLVKSTKTQSKARPIDSIIKFQLDDGIESLTIGGKEALADLSFDKKGNVTLHMNGDKDKIDEIVSLVPFVSVESDVVNDKHSVTLNLDMREFDLKVEGSDLVVVKKTITDITLDLSKVEEKFAEIERKLGEHTEKIKEAEKKIDENSNKITENLAKINENKAKIQEIVTELVEVGKKIAKNEGDIKENLEKIKSNKAELDKQLAMIEDVTSEVAEAKKAISKNADDIVDQAKKISELQEKDKTLERRINQVDDNVAQLEQDLAVTDSKVDTLEGKVNTLEGKVDTEIGNLKAKDTALEGEIGNLKTKDTALEGEIGNLKAKDTALEGEIGNLKSKDTALEGEIGNLKAKDTAFEGEIGDLKTKDTTLEGEIGNLKTKDTALEGESNKLKEIIKVNSNKIDRIIFDFNESQRVQNETTEQYNNERIEKDKELEELIKKYKIKDLDLNYDLEETRLSAQNPVLDGTLMTFLANTYGVLDETYLDQGDISTKNYYSRAITLTNKNISVKDEKIQLKEDFTTKIIGYYNSDKSVGKLLKSFLFEEQEKKKFYISNIGVQRAINNTVVCIYINGRSYKTKARGTNCDILMTSNVSNGTIVLVKMKSLGQAVIEF